MVSEQAAPKAPKSAERIEGAMTAGGDMAASRGIGNFAVYIDLNLKELDVLAHALCIGPAKTQASSQLD